MKRPDYGAMADDELAAELKRVQRDLPPRLREEILRRGPAIVPHLGEMLEDRQLWEDETEAGWAPIHALMLLIAIGSPVALPHVVAYLRRGYGDDWLTEHGQELVFALGPGCVEAVMDVALDRGACIWGRVKALHGLGLLALAYAAVREEVAQRVRRLAQTLVDKPQEEFQDDDAYLLTAGCEVLADLHDELSRELIRRACDEDRIEHLFGFREDLLEEYDQPIGRALAYELYNVPLHFADTHRKICSELDRESAAGPAEEQDAGAQDDPFRLTPRSTASPEAEPLRRSEAVGRNDPCPCGSGKKYKKRCLGRGSP